MPPEERHLFEQARAARPRGELPALLPHPHSQRHPQHGAVVGTFESGEPFPNDSNYSVDGDGAPEPTDVDLEIMAEGVHNASSGDAEPPPPGCHD
eukprot:5557685-Pyramimonas_sp.AAC.1